MIATLPRCPGCLLPLPLDKGPGTRTIEVHGELWRVHAGECIRLLRTAADMVDTEGVTPRAPRPLAEVEQRGQRPEPLPAGRGRVCADRLAEGGADIWSDDTALGSRGFPKQRARMQREARLACIGCPSLIQCVKYAAGFEWAAGTTIAGWSSPSNHNSPQADRLHPGLPAVLEQARRDRAEARRTRSKPSEAEGVPEHQSGRSGRPVADAQRAIAI